MVKFGAFWRFWKYKEIQDGGSMIAAVWGRDVMQTSYAEEYAKETFLEVLTSNLYFAVLA